MEQDKHIELSDFTKILVPVETYELRTDKRLLIPFDRGGKIGFTDSEGKVIVSPKYAMYYGECYKESDFIKVSKPYLYGTPVNKKHIDNNLHYLFGVINSKGEEVLPIEYTSVLQAISDNILFTVQNTSHQYGVVALHGQEIIPFGRYIWISGFDKGLARVIGKVIGSDGIAKERWGLIDEDGNEVLPLEYEDIWNFYGKDYSSVPIIKDGKQERFDLNTCSHA